MEASSTKAVGNGAKLREALECIDSIAKYLEAGTIRDVQHAYRNIQDRVRIALSVPPRNCDVFSKAEVLKVLEDRSFSKEDTIEWLFAEAEEAKR